MLIPKLKKTSLQQKVQWITDPVSYMDNAVKQGPSMFVADVAGSDGYVFVHHPEAIQQMMTTSRHLFFASGEQNSYLKPLVGENSMLLIEGDRHKQRRKLLLPPFHGERMQTYGRLITDLTNKVVSKLPTNKVFTAKKVANDIFFQVILEAIYGLQDDKRSEKLKNRITKLANLFESNLMSACVLFPWLQKDLGPWSPWGNVLSQQKIIDQSIYAEITARRSENNTERQDILSLMMSARDEEDKALSDLELRDELMTLMVSGQESTSAMISWALYWVHREPRVKEKLLAEINSLGKSPEPMAIAKLPYLDAVCKETLRIYPAIILTFPRVVKEPMELIGHKLETGQVLRCCIYLLHQREDIYSEPRQFKPERFLEKQFSPYEFFSFGGGQRRCIGEALAQLSMKLVLATILSNYKLALKSDHPESTGRHGVTLGPATGVKMIFN